MNKKQYKCKANEYDSIENQIKMRFNEDSWCIDALLNFTELIINNQLLRFDLCIKDQDIPTTNQHTYYSQLAFVSLYFS